jgi:signal transduction histidine kinase/integral membrane sensor domain MASE1
MRIDPVWQKLSLKKIFALNLIIFFSYVLLGSIYFSFPDDPINYNPLWIPSGFSMAMVCVFGLTQTFAGLFAGMFFVAIQGLDLNFVSLGIVFANMLEIIIASTFFKAYGNGRYRFKSPKDILGFIFLAAVLSPFIASIISTAFLYSAGILPSLTAQSYCTGRFLSGGLGILLMTPLVVSFFTKESRKVNLVEGLMVYACLGIVSFWIFKDGTVRKFMVVPALIWCSLRFGFRGTSFGLLLVGYIAFWHSTFTPGALTEGSLEYHILMIQFILGGGGIVGYLMASAVEAQEKAIEKELQLSIKEDALAILDQSLHQSPIGFALIDRGYKFIRVNESLAKLNGVEANAHLGRKLSEVGPKIAEFNECLIDDVFRTGKSLINIPFVGNPPHNSSIFLAGLLSYYPIKHPSTHEIFAVAFSFQDITEQKVIEQKLRLTESNLLHALSVRDEFLAIASHELKTPLTALKLSGQFFKRGVLKNDQEVLSLKKIGSFIDKNCFQIDRLTRLVDDMLDISRMRTGKFSLKKEYCCLSQILKDVLQKTRDHFEQSGSGQPQVDKLEDAYGVWDSLRIEQVLTNILTNAIRYGQGRSIHVSLTSLDDRVIFSVRDHGLGIPESEQEKIFERFERGIHTREISGLGLGLFITKQIVAAHHGKVWVQSKLGEGATFHVEIPKGLPVSIFNLSPLEVTDGLNPLII